VPQQQEMIAGGRYLSSDQAMRVFAAGSETNLLTIEINWRSGRRSVVSGAMANQVYEIEEPLEGRAPRVPDTPALKDERRETGTRETRPPTIHSSKT